MRDVFRVCRFRTPYGGIYVQNSENYVGIPIPSIHNSGSFVNLVDSILLKVAAVSSISDPMVSVNGRLFPTVLMRDTAQRGLSGANTVQLDDGRVFSNKFIGSYTLYAKRFMKHLSTVFSVKEGDNLVAERHIAACFAGFDYEHNRHLKVGDSIAPYFWIEPTSLLESTFQDDVAVAGFGAVAYPGVQTKYKTFEEVTVPNDTSGAYNAIVKMRSARTSGLLLHLSMHPENGLGSIVPVQFLYEQLQFARVGALVSDRVETNSPISEYLWGRGHSPIPHPAELCYTGNRFGLLIRRESYNDDLMLQVEHTPLSYNMLNEEVTLTVTRPMYFGVRGMFYEPAHV
jgi:hypothetical protein